MKCCIKTAQKWLAIDHACYKKKYCRGIELQSEEKMFLAIVYAGLGWITESQFQAQAICFPPLTFCIFACETLKGYCMRVTIIIISACYYKVWSVVSKPQYFFFKKIYCLFMLALLGLPGCTKAFSSCGEWGLPSSCGARASHYRSFSFCRAWALEHSGSIVVVPGLSCPEVSFQTSDRTHIPWVGRHSRPLNYQENSPKPNIFSSPNF